MHELCTRGEAFWSCGDESRVEECEGRVEAEGGALSEQAVVVQPKDAAALPPAGDACADVGELVKGVALQLCCSVS